ncbi:MAG: hypothetical protein MI810_02115 [Flavobacteriales bacterium]|nr:hypothetical protein [Flavobacteriales bacterium]
MKYTAITLGPIYKTMQQAKSTKAFWAASYLFSYLMKKILEEIGMPAEKYVTPYFEEIDLKDDHFPKVGLFHDRFILKEALNIKPIAEKVLENFAYKMAKDIGKDPDKVRDYCKAYFNINVLSGIELDAKDLENSVMHVMNDLLDVTELTNRINPYEKENYLIDFLEKKPLKEEPHSKYNFLHQKAFENRHFPSTAEIATTELHEEPFYVEALNLMKKDEKEGQVTFYQHLEMALKKTAQSRYRKYLKHYAIVEADGDSFGDFIKKLSELDKKKERTGKEKLLSRFSRNTLKFNQEAAALINKGIDLSDNSENTGQKTIPKMNGYAVYAGGDDLLFFAPVACSMYDENGKFIGQKSIFDLIDAIDVLFDKYFTNDTVFKPIFEEEKKNLTPVSMSYGIAITYYKHPLIEAKDASHNALVEVAKKTPKKKPVKNRLALQFIGHSGDEFNLNLIKKGEKNGAYKAFKALYQSSISSELYLNGVIQILESNEATFFGIGNPTKLENIPKNKREGLRNEKWDAFFKENFNESIHTTGKDKELIPFLQKLKDLFKIVYTENNIEGTPLKHEAEDKPTQNEKNWRSIYSMLKFISFINNQDN